LYGLYIVGSQIYS